MVECLDSFNYWIHNLNPRFYRLSTYSCPAKERSRPNADSCLYLDINDGGIALIAYFTARMLKPEERATIYQNAEQKS